MPASKKLTDLVDYTAILPYASELFGVYQPLLGWKSKRSEKRFEKGLDLDKQSFLTILTEQFSSKVKVEYSQDCGVEIRELSPATLVGANLKNTDCVLLNEIASKLPSYDEIHGKNWKGILPAKHVIQILRDSVVPYYKELYQTYCKKYSGTSAVYHKTKTKSGVEVSSDLMKNFERRLSYESAVAGSLILLINTGNFKALENIFFNATNKQQQADQIIKALSAKSNAEAYLNLENLNPADKKQLENVALSPISVVHLFRQYFFELDTFLGTSVGHVWLSPGASVELIETTTKRTLTEKTFETSVDSTTKSERSLTEEDEISDAVKEDNKQDIKFGAGVEASYASITATSNFDYTQSQQTSREETHKRMRQQTEKLSSEIRKNVKSTFRTVTEVTDTNSKRYVLKNETANLLNYEMRRKMRQVAVQVQDVGSYLCWQTYVDDPGKDLGIARLIHIAKSPDIESIPHPASLPTFQDFSEKKTATVPFNSIDGTDADNEGEVYIHGGEQDDAEVGGDFEKIQCDFLQEFICPKPNYELKDVVFDVAGKPLQVSRKGDIDNTNNKSSFVLHLDSVDFQGQASVQVSLELFWTPRAGANDEINTKNKAILDKFNAAEAQAYEKMFVENAKERVKLASKIQQRNSAEMREEERIVVYRRMIQDMLTNGISMPDDRTRHVVAELINSIFDVNKMLYFVAPEWWRPKLHVGGQQLNETRAHSKKPPILKDGSLLQIVLDEVHKPGTVSQLNSSSVGWGGLEEFGRDNYYITEDSDPAKLGSSLGWLMQLDGDNMRNAFLNAPWVKAVMPIRPGKEEAAINWLKGVEGMNGIGDKDKYHANSLDEKDVNGKALDGQNLIDVLFDLAKKIGNKHKESIEKKPFPDANEVSPGLVDEANVVTTTPIDRVYEHGFYSLKDGFRANVKNNYEIFDQWIEILPTDQVVPVEVKYDAKTGRQI